MPSRKSLALSSVTTVTDGDDTDLDTPVASIHYDSTDDQPSMSPNAANDKSKLQFPDTGFTVTSQTLQTSITTISDHDNKNNRTQTPTQTQYKSQKKPQQEQARAQHEIRINRQAIESSMRFRYLRTLEAYFEATPQCILQLVFMMRTSQFNNFIFILSILQSILSMCNSLLNSDHGYMKDGKWKKYKHRFPVPTIEFVKHSSLRLMEITARLGLLSIFWTVVGGANFVLLLLLEILLPMILNAVVSWRGLVCHVLLDIAYYIQNLCPIFDYLTI